MTRLAQMEAALVKADAAGNVEDARALAAAIRAERAKSTAATPAANPDAAQSRQEDWGAPLRFSDLGRAAGILGRDALEGTAGLVGLITDPIVLGAGAATGRNFAGMRDSAGQLADAIGLPKPETGTERVISGIQQALAGGGAAIKGGQLLAGSARPLSAAVGESLSASRGAQLTGAATGATASGVVREEGGSPGMQLAAGLLGALAPTAGPGLVAEGLRRLARGGEGGRQQMQAAIDDFAKAGTAPTLGQAAPGNTGKLAEAVVRNAPGGSGVVARRLDAQAQEIGKRVDELAGQLSPAAGAERGGNAIIRGVTGPGGFMQRFRAQSGALYDEVERLLPQGTNVPASSTQRVLGELTTPVQGAANTSAVLQNSKVASIAKAFSDDLAAGGGAIGYDAMKRLRTQVGELVDDSVLSPDTSTRQLRALYAAMSDDLTNAVKASGDPKAAQAVTRANNYYRAGMQRVEALERVIDRSGGPEAVYRAMFTNSREGGTTLRRVMQSLDGPQQKDLAAATLRRLGRANPGAQDELGEVFSPETFLTNWNRMAPEAKNALFDRFGSSYRSDLDKIAAATSRAREAAQVLANPSGTAPLGAQVTAYSALGGLLFTGNVPAAAGVGATMGISNLAARSFTNPRIVRALAQQTEMPVQAVPAAINQLAQIAKDDPEAAELLKLFEAQRKSEATL